MTKEQKTRAVLIDGQVIGRVDATLDDEQQIRAARALMRQRGLSHEVDEVEAAFRQALSFAHTSQRLYDGGLRNVPRDFFCVAPFVVNSAFSIELYLKTLGLIFSGELVKGHRLTELYDQLSDEAKSTIDAETPAAASDRGLAQDTDLRTVLENLNNAFVEWRYLHERSSTDRIEIQGAIFAMQVLHAACVTARGPATAL